MGKFNLENHLEYCNEKDFEELSFEIKEKASEIFRERNEKVLILIAELDGYPVGYAIGHI